MVKLVPSVLNCGGPSARLRHAWFSALKGKTGFAGDGVLLREIERDRLPLWPIGLVQPPGEGDTERLLEVDVGRGARATVVDRLISVETVEGPAPSDELGSPGPVAVPSAASRFFLSSASFRCCSSCSSIDKRMASMSINSSRSGPVIPMSCSRASPPGPRLRPLREPFSTLAAAAATSSGERAWTRPLVTPTGISLSPTCLMTIRLFARRATAARTASNLASQSGRM